MVSHISFKMRGNNLYNYSTWLAMNENCFLVKKSFIRDDFTPTHSPGSKHIFLTFKSHLLSPCSVSNYKLQSAPSSTHCPFIQCTGSDLHVLIRPAMIHRCTCTSRYFLPRYEYRILNKLSWYLRYIYICINKHGKALSSISVHPPSAF